MAEPRRERSGHATPVGAPVRAAAARVVHAVRGRGRSLNEALETAGDWGDTRDRALVSELSYGTLRLLARLEAVADMLLRKPLKAEDGDLRALLLVGLYQLAATRIPPHAAVAASVEAARLLGKGWAANLINALLRRFEREREDLLARAGRRSAAHWLFPDWLLARLQDAWPDHWAAIVAASNARAPMTLRVNRRSLSRPQYAAQLAAVGITARPAPHVPAGLMLEHPIPSRDLPGFEAGLVSIQDAGAQLAAELLGARPGERVLDACAAPGGKTAHILEMADNRLVLTALDADPERLEQLNINLNRLGLKAHATVGDAASPAQWGTGPYDRILLDVPCSATGVIRRHPDIKWLRRDTDIPALVAQQCRLLDAIWPLLIPGGIMLYATCSLLPEENEQQIAAFLSRHADAREVPIEAPWGIARMFGRQTLPEEGGMDGFYYARLRKTSGTRTAES